MCELIFSTQEFLKIVPGLAIFPISFYLAWKKLGTKVIASITFGYGRTIASGINYVDLTNLKDRPMAIYAIYAVLNEDISFEVDKFEPPLILKSLESMRIETQPYSQLMLGVDTFIPDFLPPNHIDLYLVLAEKIIKCQPGRHPSFIGKAMLNKYRYAVKSTSRFNGHVYNEQAAYAITYRQDKQIKTAIVDTSGFICREWNFRFNMVPPAYMENKYLLRKLLEESDFNNFVEGFSVDDLRK